jgi:hypothetical protein
MGTDNHGGIEQQKAQTSIGYVLLQLSDWREWGIGTKLVQLGTATGPVRLKEVRPVAAQVLSTTVYRRRKVYIQTKEYPLLISAPASPKQCSIVTKHSCCSPTLGAQKDLSP